VLTKSSSNRKEAFFMTAVLKFKVKLSMETGVSGTKQKKERYLYIKMLSLKHILFTTLAAAYLLASTGLVVNMHYCLGRVKAVSLAVQEEASCICPEPSTEKDCCRSEQQLLETQSTHLLAATFVFQPFYQTVVRFEPLEVDALYPVVFGKVHESRGPPESRYLRNQVFRL
jgi:hypothetical protein